MLDQEEIMQELCSRAGITLNGPNPWDLQVKDKRFYGRVLRDKTLGLGEAYMEGLWDCERLDEFICRALKAHLDEDMKGEIRFLLPYIAALLFNPQSRNRAAHVAQQHYDLGNELFLSFLDPYNQYSCAYFDGTDVLAEAQQKKLALICRKIDLRSQDHVLDIGCGWGGFARYAAEHYGCNVTGVSISKEQVRFAQDNSQKLPVQILDCEYRDLRGTFDKVVSCEMIEAVGADQYETFFAKCASLLAPRGALVLQAITIGDEHYERARREVDFIKRHVFPGSCIPSITALVGAAGTAAGLRLRELKDYGPDYARTLAAWRANLAARRAAVEPLADERFRRLWHFYLCYCEGGFAEGHIGVAHLVFGRPGEA